MAHRFDAVTIGIEHEGAAVVSVISGPKPRCAIILPAGAAEAEHGPAAGRTEADMRARNRRSHLGSSDPAAAP
jgi:hypothetical protein